MLFVEFFMQLQTYTWTDLQYKIDTKFVNLVIFERAINQVRKFNY